MQKQHKPGKKPSRPQYLSVTEAAALTGMSVSFWRRLAYDGMVNSVKLGTRLLIPRSEMDRIVAESTRPRTQASPPQDDQAPEETR